ncbi:MAG: 3',5'-cyclic adenosine monophosphate phosphodiesterase CpdA [Porticoccaceae bacterium]|nr:MAG: 3',5'-cyclic adenosine monophosphate phosphodiesterase CpdA [Porticoccaceae bacterium]
MERAARIVQLSDCHLGPAADFRLAGVHPAATLRAVLAAVATARPDLVVVTGDLAADGEPAAYRRLADLLGETALPWRWLPGNHDDPATARRWLPEGSGPGEVELAGWRLLLLDSTARGQVGGRLGAARLARLAAALAAGDEPALLFLHHPPIPVGCRWLDRQRLADAQSLADLLARHPRVRALFAGHVHQEAAGELAGAAVYTTPSTCFQFAPASDDFALDTAPPGWRWIDLHRGGAFATGVARVEVPGEAVDRATRGY